MRKDIQNDTQLDEHAARASALLRSRVQAAKDDEILDRDETLGRTQSEDPQPAPPRNAREFARRNALYIAAAAAVIVIVAIGTVVLGAFAPHLSSSNGNANGAEPAYESPYDWTKLDRTDGRYRYIVDGEVKSRLGIDVSENQHEIDWDAVATDGIDFAMIRVGYRGTTEGGLYLDEYYEANIEGARRAGLDVGAYFFSQARSVDEAVEEADFLLEQLGGIPLDYPIAFDSEEIVLGSDSPRTAGLEPDEMSAIAEAFCKRIEQAGYLPMMYGNAADLSRYRSDQLTGRSVWWAEYNAPVPAATLDIDFWQYSNAGSVAGIPTAVDMSIDLTRALD